MMGLGFSFIGMLFCLFGAVLLVALTFFGIRYFLDYTGHGPSDGPGGVRSPDYDHVGA